MSEYLGEFVIDNRTEGATITVGSPVLTNAQMANDKFPYVVEPLSGEQRFGYKLFTGIFTDASKDRIEMPITIQRKSDSATSSGTIKIYTADGNTDPSSVVFQMNIAGQVTSQIMKVGSLRSAYWGDTGIDTVVTIFNDDQNLSYTDQQNTIIDKIVDVAISSLSK